MMEKKTKEVRLISPKLECRDLENGNRVIEGYAVVFNSPATHGYTEIIDKNAFNGADLSDVVLRYNHLDSYPVLARTRNNSLQLLIDDKGLKIQANLLDTSFSNDIYKMVQEGLVDKMSFAFTVEKDAWDYEQDIRTILQIDKLFDVSVVDEPFYDTTEVYARKVEDFEKDKQEYLQRKLAFQKNKLKLMLSI